MAIDDIRLRCPNCSWHSEPSPVLDEPNGLWQAKMAVLGDYHNHWLQHRPAPIVLTGESNAD